ncbi:ERI1 exoribonuclease 3 isoform X2 [Cherax quadricarinatus]
MAKRIPQQFEYFLVLDFEATCDDGKKIHPQEIIEFPVLKVNAKTYEVDSQFHHFVKPKHNPKLTDFCMKLTTITQEEVDAGKPFPVVFEEFDKWIQEDVGLNSKFLFVTCGDWDLKTMLPSQCDLENYQVPVYCKTWLNIKKSYAVMTGEYVKGMMPMINGLNLVHIGCLHRGLDLQVMANCDRSNASSALDSWTHMDVVLLQPFNPVLNHHTIEFLILLIFYYY